MSGDGFQRALALVLELEGGFVDHPRDPGGATNLGITRATLAKARGRPVSVAEVKALNRAEAGAIYRRLYWDPIRGDELPPGLDMAVFDYAVNSGPGRAVRALQAVLGVRPDGAIGPTTLAAALGADLPRAIRDLTRERLRFLRGLSTWPVFGRGWTSRTTRVERAALAAAQAAPLPSRPAPARLLPSRPEKENTMMIETKTALASRTVSSNIVGLGTLALGMLGVQTGSIDQDGVAEAIMQIVAGISFIASTYFRVSAKKQIGSPTG